VVCAKSIRMALVERDGKRYACRPIRKGIQVAHTFVSCHRQLCGPLSTDFFNANPTAMLTPKVSWKLRAQEPFLVCLIDEIVKLQYGFRKVGTSFSQWFAGCYSGAFTVFTIECDAFYLVFKSFILRL